MNGDTSDVTYTNWRSNVDAEAFQPRRVCGVLDTRESFQWTTFPCGNPLEYICALGKFCAGNKTADRMNRELLLVSHDAAPPLLHGHSPQAHCGVLLVFVGV